ncbi:MAG: hypothetical protein NZ955_07510 [Candidatus Bathyarchaeota archaeon]|nr:hypothetical protein [Candidatus Bathyarchaeota archaeon]
MTATSRSYRVAIVIVFAALTLILNFSPLKFPAPYAPFLYYQFWEVPITAAFLLYGFKIGFSIALINTLALLAFFPGMLPTGPFYNLAAIVSMLTGVWVVTRMLRKYSPNVKRSLSLVFTIASGIVFRVAIMSVVNYVCLPQAPPVGYALPIHVVLAYLPLIAIFNSSLAAYTIPLGYILASSAHRIGKYMG